MKARKLYWLRIRPDSWRNEVYLTKGPFRSFWRAYLAGLGHWFFHPRDWSTVVNKIERKR